MRLKQFTLIFSITLLLSFSPFVLAGEIKPDLSEIISEKYMGEKVSVIIILENLPTPEDISILQSDGADIEHQYGIINAVAAQIPVQAAEKIAERNFVKLVEPDYSVKLVLDESIPQIQADRVWDLGVSGKEIDVAVLDTGIYDEHSSLSVEREIDYTGEGTNDLHGHGTHVAGIIASSDSTYRGVAFDSDLFNVKVLNKEGSGYGSDVIEGIEWAIDNGAEVLSMSFGAEIDNCDGTDALSMAVDEAVSQGIVVVVAAGNSGPDEGTITTPGCSKGAITVGAVDGNDNIPSFSSRGPTDDGRTKPDLVSPGVAIISTWKDNSFESLSGTSMSTPHVSGIVALLMEVNSTLNPSEIKESLKSTALDLGLDENTQGSGRADAYESYLYVLNFTSNDEFRDDTNDTENPKEENESDGINESDGTEEAKNETEEDSRFNPGIKPGSIFYGLDKLFERINLALTFDHLEKAKLHVEYSEERLGEAQYLIEKGDIESAQTSIEDYGESLNNSMRISKMAKGLGENTTSVDALVAEATSIHLKVLGEIYNKVPEQARSSIEKSIENSARGRENAVNALRETDKSKESIQEEIEEEGRESNMGENKTKESGEGEESERDEIDKSLEGLEDPAKTKIKEIQEKVISEKVSSKSNSLPAEDKATGSNPPSSANSNRGGP